MLRLLGSTAVAVAAASALAWVAATSVAQPNTSTSARGPPTLRCGDLRGRRVIRVEAERVRCARARSVARAQYARVRNGSCAAGARGCVVAGFHCGQWPAQEGNMRVLCVNGDRKVMFLYRTG